MNSTFQWLQDKNDLRNSAKLYFVGENRNRVGDKARAGKTLTRQKVFGDGSILLYVSVLVVIIHNYFTNKLNKMHSQTK